ncbi:MAG: GspE/PulE family protein [Gammaproteobacteria bacterium]|nr:GspE/PulE family protein [Gammaproteobacteria bacterium]
MASPDTMRRQKIRIGDLLVQHKVISENQLQEALAEQKQSGRKLGRVIVDLGFAREDQILELLSKQLDIRFIDLKHFNFKPEVVKRLPETHARRYRAIVLEENSGSFLIGMADPTDIFAFDELARLLGKQVRVALVREADLLLAIDMVYRRTQEITTLAEELGEEIGEGDIVLDQLSADDEQADAPVIKLLRSLFEDAVQVAASDIHIEPDEGILRIRQRVDGELQEQIIDNRKIAGPLVTRLKLISGLDIAEKRLPQDGRFSIRVKNKTLDVRLSTMPTQHGEAVVMRLLDQSAGLLQLEELGMQPEMMRAFTRIIRKPSGMVLVTGPTGSGKTTTLYSALNRINTEQTKIITVEDPVEYRLPRISQVQVNTRIGLDFARVLRTTLRQDPDVILVGEIRDQETAEIAMRAAITGHFVMSTLHTSDAVSTIARLLDMGVEGYMVAAALDAVVAQRLVRRVCESCAEPVEFSFRDREFLSGVLGYEIPGDAKGQVGSGCTYCSNTGYRGRIGVYELLEVNREMASAIRRADNRALEQHAHGDFKSLVQMASEYALQGVTSLHEVKRLAGSLDEFMDSDLLDDPLAAQKGEY